MKDSSKTLDNIRKLHKSTGYRHPSLDLRDLVPPAQLRDKQFTDKSVSIFILFTVFVLWSTQACAPSLDPGLSKVRLRGQEPKSSSTTAGASVRPAAAITSVPPARGTGTKKLIYYGWGIRDTQYIRDSWRQMEEMPFDGVGIAVAIDRQAWQRGKIDTDNQLGWQVMGQRAFREEEFRDAIADLKEAKWKRLTDNFFPVILSAASAKGLNWFDDERWRIVVNNFGILAKIAAEGGAKGLLIDPEQYSPASALFSSFHQRQQMDKSVKEYKEIARQRGRQVMTAISAHLPEAVLFSLFGYSVPLDEIQHGTSPQKVGYDLLPAFYDGLLEAMPTKAYLVDASGAALKERKQFLDNYRRIHQAALTLSAVPDHYREKVKVGIGLWLDYNKQPYYFTPGELQRLLEDALEVSDGYAWIYSQAPRFFPPAKISASYIEAIAAARRLLAPKNQG